MMFRKATSDVTEKRTYIYRIKLIALLAVVSVIAVSCWNQSGSGGNSGPTLTAEDLGVGKNAASNGTSYGQFSHTVKEHEDINCTACHGRQGTKLEYAGHSSCTECHFREFVNSESQICSICHTTSPTKPDEMLAFPASFKEGFNMKFNHDAHSRGSAKPAQGCAACHSPQASSQTIPVGIGTHSQCFTCHTEESNIGSCNVCHDIAPYQRTRQGKSAVLNYVFSHSDHTSRQGVTCTECHSTVANAPQGKQVLAPVAAQHFRPGNARGAVTCASCHNNRRAFGERDFADCKRCHSGSGFTLIPN